MARSTRSDCPAAGRSARRWPPGMRRRNARGCVGGAVEARHHGRRPGIVVKVKSREAAVLSFPEGGDRRPPPGVEFLSIQRLGWEQRQTIAQRHGTFFTLLFLA